MVGGLASQRRYWVHCRQGKPCLTGKVEWISSSLDAESGHSEIMAKAGRPVRAVEAH